MAQTAPSTARSDSTCPQPLSTSVARRLALDLSYSARAFLSLAAGTGVSALRLPFYSGGSGNGLSSGPDPTEDRVRVSRLPLLLAVAVSLLGIGLAPSLALANCYETFGCTNSQYFDAAQLQLASCQILWEMRN
jgi:hypothetical protein